ncbi:MAG TPA: cytochrome c maturation protein CcmE [Acidimicrobiales bacterium]|nr:cytochrome c maturation protein CcmE [Acidimicrobiales bacterium]
MKRRALVIVVVAVLAAGGLLWRALGDATVYFKTADEAAAERATLGERRFRLEGVVLAGSVKNRGDGVQFVVAENGAQIPVRHKGDPPELFRAGIPVVLEGHFQGATYESDRILVKHTSEYRKVNPERVKDYGSDP